MKQRDTPAPSRVPPALQNEGPDLSNWLLELRERWACFLEDAASIAELILDTCDTCGKPDSLLWFRIGKHSTCQRLERDL